MRRCRRDKRKSAELYVNAYLLNEVLTNFRRQINALLVVPQKMTPLLFRIFLHIL